jgi:hypothetical protein
MSPHRFSNSKRTRDWVASAPYPTWESVPQPLRILILEFVNQIALEVLNEQATDSTEV